MGSGAAVVIAKECFGERECVCTMIGYLIMYRSGARVYIEALTVSRGLGWKEVVVSGGMVC